MTPITILAPKHGGERWDWRSPERTGIGGSETAVIEMARRLSLRGHPVTVYANVGSTTEDPGGARWRFVDEARFDAPGLWIVHRCAEAGELLRGRVFHVTHDLDPPEEWTPERAAGFERIFCLSRAQMGHYRRTWPFMAGKLALWGNGINTEAMDAGDEDAPPRDPKRLIYSSSPDRGLLALLHIFRRAYEIDDGLSLDVYYGWSPNWPWADLKAEIERLADHPGVFWHGRVPQQDLHEAFRSSAIWCYPTHFTETSCITCMEAQALGAIPIINPFWALAENVKHGIAIEGNPADYLTRARYVEAILALANDEVKQEVIRGQMMEWARRQHSWEARIDELEQFIGADVREAVAA